MNTKNNHAKENALSADSYIDLCAGIATLRLLCEDGGIFSYTKEGMLEDIGAAAFVDRYELIVDALAGVLKNLCAVKDAVDQSDAEPVSGGEQA